MIPECDREGRNFLSTPNTHDRFFFLNTFHFLTDVFNNAVTSIADVRHFVMTLLLRLMTSLRTVNLNGGVCDVHYNQSI